MKNKFFWLLIPFLLYSCARVGSPVGGKKDTLAPKFLGANIDSTRVKVPRNQKELKLYFDEYVVLKDISKNLIISPPIKNIKKILPTNLANKFILIQWQDSLQANTTYSFNFGNSITDNNESNVLPYFNFAFSTGDKIDDLYISGTVKNIFSKNKSTDKKNCVVGLYQDKDSMDYRKKPYYITKADDDGYYELNYLSPGNYRILAFDDENANSVYDAGKENVGFLAKKLELNKNTSGLDLNIMPSKKTLKSVETKIIPGGVLLTFEGNPNKVEVQSETEKLKDYKVTQSAKSDSVFVWFDAKKQEIGTTASENLKLNYDADSKKGKASVFYKYNPKNEMQISNRGANLLPPKKDFVITANMPVQKILTEKWDLKSDSISQPLVAKISEKNPFQILVSSDFKPGKKYQLTVPKETVLSYYDQVTKPYRFDFEQDKIENYGTFTLKLTNKPKQQFWIQLLNDKGDVQYEKLTIDAETKFTELKPGTYNLRILVDNNGNLRWDEGDFANSQFAEDVFLFNKNIEVRTLWEIVEDWDLNKKEETPKK